METGFYAFAFFLNRKFPDPTSFLHPSAWFFAPNTAWFTALFLAWHTLHGHFRPRQIVGIAVLASALPFLISWVRTGGLSAAEYNPLPTLHLILSSILIMAAILFALLQFARRSSSINHTARQKRLRNFNAVILVICLAGLHDISLSSYADARSEFPQLVGHLIAVAYLVFVTSILLPSLSGGLPHSGRWRVAHLSARIMVGAGLCVYLYLFGTLAKIFLSRPVKYWEMTY